MKIAEALKELGRLGIARSYLGIDDNLAAIIAWVEFERSVRSLIDDLRMEAVPRSQNDLKHLWARKGRGRNEVIHRGLQLAPGEAREIMNDVVEFLTHNSKAAIGEPSRSFSSKHLDAQRPNNQTYRFGPSGGWVDFDAPAKLDGAGIGIPSSRIPSR